MSPKCFVESVDISEDQIFFLFFQAHEFERVDVAQQIVIEQLELKWLQRRVALF
jgi:hypothetical protein